MGAVADVMVVAILTGNCLACTGLPLHAYHYEVPILTATIYGLALV